ncbi:sce7725 family protein [Stenotrophomonas bentonitica]
MLAYYPYFRGKQYELICIRESAALIAANGLKPIIEVVRPDPGSLGRCLSALEKHHASALVLYKSGCGPLKDGLSEEIKVLVEEAMAKNPLLGWIVRVEDFLNLAKDDLPLGQISLLHDSPADAGRIIEAIGQLGIEVVSHIFVEGGDAGKLYRARFKPYSRVLVKDGFKRKKNADYIHPEVDPFSDLYLTYGDEGLQGFGDFLTVGSYYAEGGGQAYAVAIHITFKNEEADGAIFVHHFVSDSNDTPADPAAKFHEALEKLARAIGSPNCKILRTQAVEEFLDLHRRGHYPGLGYVKKLSMQHHLELMVGAVPR